LFGNEHHNLRCSKSDTGTKNTSLYGNPKANATTPQCLSKKHLNSVDFDEVFRAELSLKLISFDLAISVQKEKAGGITAINVARETTSPD
jgi:hypothetical protein